MTAHDPTTGIPVAPSGPPSEEMADDTIGTDSEHTGPLSTSLDALVGRSHQIAQRAPSLRPAEIGLADDYDDAVGELLEGRRLSTWRRSIPQRYHRAQLDDLTVALKGHAWEQIGGWSRGAAGRNLIIGGPVGAGKTHAAIAACRSAHMDRGMDVRFLPGVELMDHLRPGTGGMDLADIVDVDLLIVDDVDAIRPSEWTDERLYSIINRRWLEELPTVVTANLGPRDLAEALGPRVYSRLAGGAVVIAMAGADRRMVDR